MRKEIWIRLIGVCVIILLLTSYFIMSRKEETLKQVSGTVLSLNDEFVIVQDENDITYKFKMEDFILDVGDRVVISYTGLLDSNKDIQDISIKEYSKTSNPPEEKKEENGIFKDYYVFAQNKLKTMSLEEKINQMLLVQLPTNSTSVLQTNQFGGLLLFANDFKNKTKDEVVQLIQGLQNQSKIPLLIAVDEEGGSVVRVSSNPNLAPSKFVSPSELYQNGGLEAIKEDTVNKSLLLESLGINLNLAPVVDVSTNSSDYMYNRTIKEDTTITSNYAKTVIEASKGGKVSYTLKHFPGYGNNADTHNGSVTDHRTYDSIVRNDLPPFEAGIKAGAEAVLVSHNIVNNIDSANPASLSIPIHNILRDDLHFTGVIITDDLTMGALDSIDQKIVKAIEAGNDLLIVSDYIGSINEITEAINQKRLSIEVIDDHVTRILAWKYYKGMIYENQK